MSPRSILSITAAIIISIVTHIPAGELDPPATPQPTPGPEPRIAVNADNTPGDDNSVYQIIAAGSYYLTGNVFVAPNFNGIEIIASDVTLDLNGFSILRGRFPVTDPPTLDGIAVLDGLENVSIHGGSINRMGGVALRGNAVHSIQIEDLRIANCGSGVTAGPGALVSRCTVIESDFTGFNIFDDSSITDCVARENGTDGLILNGNGIMAHHNICEGNGGSGILVNTGTFGSRVEDNLVRGNVVGVAIYGSGHLVARNTAAANTTNYLSVGSSAIGPIVGTGGSTNPWANFDF